MDQQTEVDQPATESPPSKRPSHAAVSHDNTASDINIIAISMRLINFCRCHYK